MNQLEITSLHIYPIKSCGAIDLNEASFGTRGFNFDRNWMIVNPEGKKISQRENTKLVFIKPDLTDAELVLKHTDHEPVKVPLNQNRGHREVEIWGHKCASIDEGDLVANWLSNALGQEARLVRFDPNHKRPVDPHWAGSTGAHTGFADELPFLITFEESLAALNKLRADAGLAPSTMDRFRPNIVVQGAAAFDEDGIAALRLPRSDVRLELVKPCGRCQVINVDQVTGEKEKQGNLQILAKHRNFKDSANQRGVMFGIQAFATGADGSALRVGDNLEIAEPLSELSPLPRFS